MSAFINGTAMISPQNTVDRSNFLEEIVEYTGDYLACIDPNFKEYINPIAIRRMSRLIRMGITAARMSLEEANVEMPDAIITGTGLGSVEDTEKILSAMREDEKFFNPTPFIQSTYNTISSQVAITLKCHGYNSTYVHRNFSFESTLQDALMQLDEKIATNVLAGGIDEMTLNHLAITLRAGHWKKEKVSNLNLLSSRTAGSLAGEGAGFFVLSSQRSGSTYATLRAVKTFYKPGTSGQITAIIEKFLSQQSLSMQDIDIVLLGLNGDARFDPVYHELMKSQFRDQTIAYYKHLCGEYFTSTAFALWMAANILKRQFLPEITVVRKAGDPAPANILIYNQYHNTNHSLVLVSA